MSELEFYKWVQEWEPEWRWDINSETKEDDVIIWVSIYSIESFCRLIDMGAFNDGGGLDARLQDRYIAIFAAEICNYYGIEIENVFPKQ